MRREAGAPSLLGDATRRTAFGADTNMDDVIRVRFGGAGVKIAEQGPACGMRPASGAGVGPSGIAYRVRPEGARD